jgi:hypothetical protein
MKIFENDDIKEGIRFGFIFGFMFGFLLMATLVHFHLVGNI